MAGVPVVFFTLEMTASELGERMVLAESSADPLRIRQGRLSPEEVEDVHRTAERMSALPVPKSIGVSLIGLAILTYLLSSFNTLQK